MSDLSKEAIDALNGISELLSREPREQTPRNKDLPERVDHSLSDRLKDVVDALSKSSLRDELAAINEQLRRIEDCVQVDIEGNPFPSPEDWQHMREHLSSMMKSDTRRAQWMITLCEQQNRLLDRYKFLSESMTELAKNSTVMAEHQETVAKSIERLVTLVQIAKT